MMKKILVPTDFSECAQYAADVAIDIAARLDAEVLFYTRVDVHPLWDQIEERSRRDFPESFARIQEAKVKFQALRQQYEDCQVKISFVYSHGDLVQNIIETIDQGQIYMIIMGSRGADGHGPQLFGSNTQKVVKHAHCPVMVVKQPVPDIRFEHIVFASDFRPEAKQPFSRLIEFARHFGATLHLLNLDADRKSVV
jgi:nucleotide-binding universal stress UspA family protein